MSTYSARLRTAYRRSSLSAITEASVTSTVPAWTWRAIRPLIRWAHYAKIFRILQVTPLFWRRSHTFRVLDTIIHWTRNSAFYSWLTTRPEPEVIVIDLRETYTVGSIIELLDEVFAGLAPAYERSRLRSIGSKSASAFRAAPIRLASFAVLGLSITWLVIQLVLATPSINRVLPPMLLATIASLGTRIQWSMDDLADSRVGATIRAALAPPELDDQSSKPPEDDNDRSG